MKIILFVTMFLGLGCYAEEVPKTGICIVEQYRKDCGPCVRLSKELDRLGDLKITIIKELISGEAPILIFYKDGKAVKVIIGYITEGEIRAKIDEVKKDN